ncbi:dynein intermediate chain [Trichuris trichiura]|uniref:Dynein intermediate chain n=1 Tax=Trichuris trichiura TaxID=36087 RepID=A0A077ZCC2_TRITR|nr:dynein intermediate chain [Trichuris trichiura]
MHNQSDRKAELERKKAKLAAIREEKKRKEEERRKQNTEASFNNDVESGGSRNLREEADKILTELGIAPVSDGLPLSSPADESISKNADLGSETTARNTSLVAPTDIPKRPVELQATEPVVISISPRQQITYCKSTQTIADHNEKELTAMHMYEWDDEFGGGTQHGRSVSVSSPEEVFDMDSTPAHIIAGILPHVELIKPTEVPKGGKANEAVSAPAAPLPELTEEEKQSFLSSEELQSFLVRASRVVERAIAEKDDVFADYGRGIEQDKLDTSVKLSLNRCFYDESLSRGRVVNCIDFSVQYPELMAVAYDGNPDAMNDPIGLVTIWNGKFKKNTPEYCFHSQSRVLSLTWAKFHPNLLVGGTYSGQICLWDMRQSKRTPIQKSALSTSAHTHPIYCLEVVGSANAHNIVSVSKDGKLCSWSLEMLSQPQETLDLQLKQSKQVGAYCMRFAPNDVNNFFIGSDDGCVYAGCRHGNKAGITEVYEGHSGPTVGMDCHTATGPIDFSNLMLTCSFDWTVKLWNTKEFKPLYSFENYSDYVLNVAWSPAHPALFASVDCTGKLELWHLNQDTELPVASLIAEDGAALKSLVWARSGMQVVVGGDNGKIWAYDVNEQLAVPTPNEWSLLSKTLYELKQNEMEAEELNATLNFR